MDDFATAPLHAKIIFIAAFYCFVFAVAYAVGLFFDLIGRGK